MKLSGNFLGVLTVLALGVGALVWSVARDATSQPYTVQRRSLSGWTIVAGQPDDPWVVGALPPPAFSDSLLRQVSEKTHRALLAPGRPSLPLVMRDEYAEGLQGVYGADAIMRIARNTGIETTTFEPVCVGHRIDPSQNEPGEIFFVVFSSPDFARLRQALVPAFPEHAGTGMYYPETLRPILAIAATGGDFARWWPMRIDEPTDCQAQVVVK